MESDLVNDLNLDSLDLVDLALSVEQVLDLNSVMSSCNR